jgi:type I restriction enzyme R subunit
LNPPGWNYAQRQPRNNQGEGASIIDDVDFEQELIHRDEINVAYILTLLARLHRTRQEESADEYEKAKKAVRLFCHTGPNFRAFSFPALIICLM